jgi:hypothetical protein
MKHSGEATEHILLIPMAIAWEIAWAPFWEFDEQGSLKV